MDQNRNIKILLACGVVLIICALILSQVFTSGLGEQILSKRQEVVEVGQDVENPVVAKVTDGDTFILADGRRVRLIGLDTPEMVDKDKKPQCFAVQAKTEVQRLLESKRVRLEKDITNRDKYGRLLRYVYVADESGREIFINNYLLAQGYARVLNIDPDLRFNMKFIASADEARFQLRGLWSACY